MEKTQQLPRLGFVYLDHVLRFFDKSNFKGWPDKIEHVVYHWGNDKQRFINEVKRKKIQVLIGNIPATAYETFREIARALPEVKFIPSLDAQFANKSKENVTNFCQKYQLPIPETKVFYEKNEALEYLAVCQYPKIIKKSYGPSNYGGYYVHKVDNFLQAQALLNKKRYYPVYVQQFIPMVADIRVMLVGHKPVCAFWRRPPEGEWLTNTSQGGAIDYYNVPKTALDIAVRASKASNAEYWACDIALGNDGKFRILECATAFAAFPYIRDWIGQYLMWQLSNGEMKKPYIPLNNWEELGKINAQLLRTMRHISFGRPQARQMSEDCADALHDVNEDVYQLLPVELRAEEEWPSEQWNLQDNYQLAKTQRKRHRDEQFEAVEAGSEGSELAQSPLVPFIELTEHQLSEFFQSIKGIGRQLYQCILNTLGVKGTLAALNHQPQLLLQVKNLKEKKLNAIISHWQQTIAPSLPENK
ncbi:hypothetical protein tinsulaeT_31100 [Thalassotalea insulae]|uniref:ATP-grasp domain-containing protein n=1 Tax=Thalassotalea insulae TaxID=2056778 RepID=A0ABQ6GV07_9GAMM|nr:hypothetical protein [Thalassotalea insulae]GLX79770.1 hypothetical protein tinsulaeT_31100 [Thalassotalea insulae]